MTSHPQDKADKSIRLPEKGVGFVTIAKGICYNDKKDLLHQDGCMGGFQVLQQKVDISGCRRWNRKNNEVVKETLHICSTIIILLPSGCEPRAGKYLIESVTQARRPYWRRDVPPMSRSLPNRKLICRQPKTKKQYEADIFAKSFFCCKIVTRRSGGVACIVRCVMPAQVWNLWCMVVCCTYEIGWSLMLHLMSGVLCCAYEIGWFLILHLMYGVLRVRMRYDGLR